MIRPLRRAHRMLSVVLLVGAAVLIAVALAARLPQPGPMTPVPAVQP